MTHGAGAVICYSQVRILAWWRAQAYGHHTDCHISSTPLSNDITATSDPASTAATSSYQPSMNPTPRVDDKMCTKVERDWLHAGGLQERAVATLVEHGYSGRSSCLTSNICANSGLVGTHLETFVLIVEAYKAWDAGWGPWLIRDASSERMQTAARKAQTDTSKDRTRAAADRARQQASLVEQQLAKALLEMHCMQEDLKTADADLERVREDYNAKDEQVSQLKASASKQSIASQEKGNRAAEAAETAATHQISLQSQLDTMRLEAASNAATAETLQRDLLSQLSSVTSDAASAALAARMALRAAKTELSSLRSGAASALSLSQETQLSLLAEEGRQALSDARDREVELGKRITLLEEQARELDGRNRRERDAPRSLCQLVREINSCRAPTCFVLPRNGVWGSENQETYVIDCRHEVELCDGMIYLGHVRLSCESLVVLNNVSVIGGIQNLRMNRLMF